MTSGFGLERIDPVIPGGPEDPLVRYPFVRSLFAGRPARQTKPRAIATPAMFVVCMGFGRVTAGLRGREERTLRSAAGFDVFGQRWSAPVPSATRAWRHAAEAALKSCRFRSEHVSPAGIFSPFPAIRRCLGPERRTVSACLMLAAGMAAAGSADPLIPIVQIPRSRHYSGAIISVRSA